MREALEDAELDMLEGLDIGSCQWQDGAELDAAGAVCLNAVPALIRDVRDARDAAEQAVAARAVSLGANHVLIIYAGEEGPIKVADQLQELATRAAAANRRADEAQRQLATVVAELRAAEQRLGKLTKLVTEWLPEIEREGSQFDSDSMRNLAEGLRTFLAQEPTDA